MTTVITSSIIDSLAKYMRAPKIYSLEISRLTKQLEDKKSQPETILLREQIIDINHKIETLLAEEKLMFHLKAHLSKFKLE